MYSHINVQNNQYVEYFIIIIIRTDVFVEGYDLINWKERKKTINEQKILRRPPCYTRIIREQLD